MLQRGQLLAGPASGLAMGLLTSLFYTRALGWPLALSAGALLGALLAGVFGWMAYRSDFAARHLFVGLTMYPLMMGLFAGGTNLLLVHLAGLSDESGSASALAWLLGMAVAIVPLVGSAWAVRARLNAEGDDGPWVRQHLDRRAGLLKPGALVAPPGHRPSMTAWQVGALAANVPLLWRLQGGSDTGLMTTAMVLLVVGLVWAGVAQAGPALGKAWFLLELERRSGQRLRNPDWDEIQATRRSHWLARWFMREG